MSDSIEVFAGLSVDGVAMNAFNKSMILDKYGLPDDERNNGYSISMIYPKHGLSFCYKIDDALKIIFYIELTGEVPATIYLTNSFFDVANPLIFDKNLAIDQVFERLGFVNPTGNDGRPDDAYFKYSYLTFYIKKEQLIHHTE